MRCIITTFFTYLAVLGCSADPRINSQVKSESLPESPRIADYRLPLERDEFISGQGQEGAPTAKSRIEGHLVMPATASADNRVPLVLILHGQAPECGIDLPDGFERIVAGSFNEETEKCHEDAFQQGPNDSFFKLIPHHLGYDYIAQALAKQGFASLAVNLSSGIVSSSPMDDQAVSRGRGRQALKNLKMLKECASVAQCKDSSLAGLIPLIDWSNVGILGHSRGGDAARSAYNQLKERALPREYLAALNDVQIKAIAELAPTDHGVLEGSEGFGLKRIRHWNAEGIPWAGITGDNDGDVSDFALLNHYNRIMRLKDDPHPKMVLAVRGANHFHFNTEWHHPDQRNSMQVGQLWDTRATAKKLKEISPEIAAFTALDPERVLYKVRGSTQQQEIAKYAVSEFFRAYVGKNASREVPALFDPGSPIPQDMAAITSFARDLVIPEQRQKTAPAVFSGEHNARVQNLPDFARSLFTDPEIIEGHFQSAWEGFTLELDSASLPQDVQVASFEMNEGKRSIEAKVGIPEGTRFLNISLAAPVFCPRRDEGSCSAPVAVDNLMLALGSGSEVALSRYAPLSSFPNHLLFSSFSQFFDAEVPRVTFEFGNYLPTTFKIPLADLDSIASGEDSLRISSQQLESHHLIISSLWFE